MALRNMSASPIGRPSASSTGQVFGRRQDAVSSSGAEPGEYSIAIIGAGMSGIAAAVRLLDAGIDDFVILEREAGVGGTWRGNTYPGCGCDVPSSLYSYSFAPNPSWTRMFARQPEILDYLESTAQRFGVLPHVALDTEVSRAAWDDTKRRWLIDTPQGRYLSRALINGPGPLNAPSIPDIKGLGNFRGTVFHSAQWDHSCDLRGKTVAVIGNGASAMQFLPQIQPQVSRLYSFQRTPQWVLPHFDMPLGPFAHRLFRSLPFLQRAYRAGTAVTFEAINFGFRHPAVMRRAQHIARWHMHRQVKDTDLRAALTPKMVLGCKRLLLSNTWYPALTAPNAVVVPHALVEVGADYVVGADGIRREVDTIIFGTGFEVATPPMMWRLFGRDGRSAAEIWNGAPQAYLGTVITGFPNLFQMLGPNAISQTSCMDLVEGQLDYVIDALRQMNIHNIDAVDIRPEVQRAHQQALNDALKTTVWSTEHCRSYFHDETGHNFAAWPWTVAKFKRQLHTFDLDAYTVHNGIQHNGVPS